MDALPHSDERQRGSTVTVTGDRQKAAWAARVLPPVEHLHGNLWSVPVPIPGNPLRYTLSYLVPGGSGLVVVDPGWDSQEGWDALCRGLTAAGASPADVTGIVATHVHPDHHGMTARLKAASDAWVAMHPAEAESLPHRQSGAEPARSSDAVRTWLLNAGASEDDVRELLGPAAVGSPKHPPFRLVEPDVLLEDGDSVPLPGRSLVAVWTPGHTPGHLCLAESSARVVLTGDHVLPRITPNLGLHGRHPEQDSLADFLHSLERLAAWDDHEALPAHEYRFRGLAARTRQLRDHHAQRLDELRAVVDASGRPSLWDVTAQMTWARPWDEVGAMRIAALAETDAHVRHLENLGELIRSGPTHRPVRISRARPHRRLVIRPALPSSARSERHDMASPLFPELDPNTPVVVGVGQASERLDDPDYQHLSPVELAAAAAREALADTSADTTTVASVIDTVAGIRQFEISTPGAPAPLGRSDNYPRSVARRIGADPARAILEIAGGHGPQYLVNELAATIARGGAQAALVFGSEAISTTQALAKAEDRPDFTEQVGGQLEDRGWGLAGLMSMHQTAHGLTDAPSQYALFDNARRARLGLSRQEYAAGMGALFAPFTEVAAENPHAAAPVRRSAEELVTVTEKNRMIADPYPRYVVARDKVNQGAAVLLMSVSTARRLGVPEERWVFLHGHADLRERNLMERADLSRSPAAVMAAEHALEVAGIGVADLATLDLYSCFPIAVSNVTDGLGVAADDPRGLTLTGGLPFFGGAGNNYSMHAIAETVHRARTAPGSFGLVGANGGSLSKYSVGVYSTTPTAWRPDRSARLQAEIDAWDAPEEARRADGWATIETYTVKHGRDGARTGVVIGRLEADDRRFIALTHQGDDDMLDLLSADEPIGRRVYARSFGFGNRVTSSEERMDTLFPRREPVLRDDYEYVTVRREGHLLEVTINRPEARNSLTPQANDELDEVFDAYFADPDLWVAILTGAGDKSFSAGNDLKYSASGKPMWVPKNGFAGLTSRRNMTKPVIAAVNGYAMGGGCEIALACHLTVADETARFALSEVKVGLAAGAGGLVRLPRAVPRKIATEMILTGRQVTADEALALGLVNQVVPAGKALEGARSLAADILDGSPTSVRASLQVMAETEGIADTWDAVDHPSPALDGLMVSQDAIEGMTAFAQKRRPQWKNR